MPPDVDKLVAALTAAKITPAALATVLGDPSKLASLRALVTPAKPIAKPPADAPVSDGRALSRRVAAINPHDRALTALTRALDEERASPELRTAALAVLLTRGRNPNPKRPTTPEREAAIAIETVKATKLSMAALARRGLT